MRPAPVCLFVVTSGGGGTALSVAATEAEAWRLALASAVTEAFYVVEDDARVGRYDAELGQLIGEAAQGMCIARVELPGHFKAPRILWALAGLLSGWRSALTEQAARALAELRPEEVAELQACAASLREQEAA